MAQRGVSRPNPIRILWVGSGVRVGFKLMESEEYGLGIGFQIFQS